MPKHNKLITLNNALRAQVVFKSDVIRQWVYSDKYGLLVFVGFKQPVVIRHVSFSVASRFVVGLSSSGAFPHRASIGHSAA